MKRSGLWVGGNRRKFALGLLGLYGWLWIVFPDLAQPAFRSSGILPGIAFQLAGLALSWILLSNLWGYGGLLKGHPSLRDYPTLMREILAGAIVFALSAVYIYLLGFFQLLRPSLIVPVILLGWSLAMIRLVRTPFKPLEKPAWSRFQWVLALLGSLLILLRLGRVFTYNPFGDPLYYNLAVGVDYLKAGGIQWLEWETFYPQAGFIDLWLIYLHALSPLTHLTQIAAQGFYFVLGPILTGCFAYQVFLRRWFAKEIAALIGLFLVMIPPFRLESLVAKPDLTLMLLFLLTLELWRSFLDKQGKNRQNWIFFLVLLQLSIKITAALYLFPLVLVMLVTRPRDWLARAWPEIPLFALGLVVGLLNPIKNWLLMGNPFYPLLQERFSSPHLKQLAEGLSGNFAMGSGPWGSYLERLGEIWGQLPLSLLFILVALVLILKGLRPQKMSPEDRAFLLHLCLAALGGFAIWRLCFSPQVYLRFLEGMVYLFLLIPLIWVGATGLLARSEGAQSWMRWLGILAILSLCHSGTDWKKTLVAYQAGSREQAWVQASEIAELTHYLSQKMPEGGLLLPYYNTNRLHAPYLVFSSYPQSHSTSFVFSSDPEIAAQGLADLAPDYYALEKRFVNQEGRIMAKREFLKTQMTLEKELRGYLVYRYPRP